MQLVNVQKFIKEVHLLDQLFVDMTLSIFHIVLFTYPEKTDLYLQILDILVNAAPPNAIKVPLALKQLLLAPSTPAQHIPTALEHLHRVLNILLKK
jgi:hypothetical protein